MKLGQHQLSRSIIPFNDYGMAHDLSLTFLPRLAAVPSVPALTIVEL